MTGTLVLAVSVALLAACSALPAGTPASASPEPSPTGGLFEPSTQASLPEASPVDHPTEANALVLRLAEVGGLVAPGSLAIELPSFSLYGDGTVIYARRLFMPAVTAGPPALGRATLDAPQMNALLAFAQGEGGLAEARADYPDPSVADGTTSIFSIRSGGLDKSVSVYALGFVGQQTPDVEIRGRFERLATILRDFGAQVEAGGGTDQGLYEPPAYRAVLTEAEAPPPAARAWPWADLRPDDFTARPDCVCQALLTPDQARQLAASPEGGLFPIAVRGPDGKTYTIALRPLLPDETK